MFYESEHSLREDLVKFEAGENFSFPPHLHGSFELITVTEGALCAKIDGTAYEISVGEALLVFPNQLHELICEQSNRHFLCIFSPQLVHAYSKVFLSSFPVSSRFSPDPFYLHALMEAAERPIGTLAVKGLLYSLCAAFDEGASYLPKSEGQESLLSEIFRFVEQNYSGECSLRHLASHTAYHYGYLSQLFKRHTGLSFTEYVNRYRVAEACYRLESANASILSIALACGFNSLRSFNRNFKRVMDKTPTEYRMGLTQKAQNCPLFS